MAIVLALVTCFVVIPLGGLAVDIGMQRVARGDMQTIADLTATDMARVLGTGGTPTSAMAATSALRDQGFVGGTPTMTVYLGYISPTAAFVSSQARGCGTTSPYDSYFAEVPEGGSANAVLVTATNKVSFVIDSGSGAVCRSAVAKTSSSACFSMGSYAVAINSGDSDVLKPLNDIFGLNLSLLSYQNIAGAHLTLAQLASNIRFGTATELLNGSISVNNLVLAMIDVLNAQSPSGNAAAISALDDVLEITAGLPAITLSNLLHISPTDSAALATNLDVLDILAGSVLLADGNHAITIPNVWAGVAGTGETSSVQLYVQQGANTACGAPNTAQASADNSQLNGSVNFDKMNSPSINIGVANLKTGTGTGELTMNIAPAHAQLISPPPVVCGKGTAASPTTFSVQVSSALASESLETQLPVTGSVTIAGLGAVSLNLVVDVTVGTTRPAGTGTANISIPPNDTTPVSTGSPIRLDPTTAVITMDPSSSVTLLGLPVSLSNPLLTSTFGLITTAVDNTFVEKSVDPLVGNLNTIVTGPLAEMLGLDVGGADVFGIQTGCDKPIIAG